MKKLIVSIISFLRARTKVAVILMALVGLLGLSSLAMAEDPVYFADASLKVAVERELFISDPTPTDMLLLTSLYADNRGIVDLTGIEYATNLTEQYLRYNQISDISALSGLPESDEGVSVLQSDQRHLSTGRAYESNKSFSKQQPDQRHPTSVSDDILEGFESSQQPDQRHLRIIGADKSGLSMVVQQSDQRHLTAVRADESV